MNSQAQTAGKTAIQEYRNAILTDRRAKATNIIQDTNCALIFYLDEDMRVRTYAVSEDGYETMQLQILSSAANIAKNVVQNVMED